MAGDRFVWYNPNGSARLWTEGNGDLVTITAGGNVGIGQTDPGSRLTVRSGWSNWIQLEDNIAGNQYYFHNPADGSRFEIGTYDAAANTFRWCIFTIRPSGNIGIGTCAPTERLQVSGNLRLDGAFMPGGNPGAAGQVLRSQGPGNAPIWFPMAASIVYQGAFNSTANVCINSPNWTTHPGVSVTFTLQAGDYVWAWASGAAMADDNCDGTANGRCDFDARIAVNGNDFPNGAWLRGSADYSGLNYSAFTPYTLAGMYHVPANGNYTFALQTRRYSGGGCLTAGNNLSSLQTTMLILVLRP
ncbi:MAG: hypothetical protein NZ958_08325 [Bacteroidia bacterium]|nr:hypothetical protein [Bacteroidia bacterium]MDW8088512.1 hypothetical protein [Bacteroidia bacterium]